MKDRIIKREKDSENLISKITPRLRELGLSDYTTAMDTMLEQAVYEQIKEVVNSHEQMGATLRNTLEVVNNESAVLEAAIPENADGNSFKAELEVQKKRAASELAGK
ncbi:MAG: hypothetical protein IPK46_20995, partial [Saprospiraceae bacterium]|nr:hypothetical protein [Saprospiraceae bacterium]